MDDADQAEPAATERGPRWWIVLGVTAVVVGVLVGGGVAVNRWVLNDDEEEIVAATTTTVDETIDVEPVSAGTANRLFVRETEAGIEIRVHETDDEEMVGMFGPGFGGEDDDRPAWCRVDSMVTVSALSADAVGQTQLPRSEEPPPDGAVTLGQGGMLEGAPMVLVAAAVAPGVMRALLSHPAGGSDSMEPIDGLVAMAIALPPPDPDDDDAPGPPFGPFGPFGIDMSTIALEFLHEDGTSSRLGMDDLFRGPPIWASPECQMNGPFEEQVEVSVAAPELPELELPKPGPEQPLDPAAERAAIEAVLERLYTGVGDDATLFETLDDPSGIDILMDDLLDGQHGDELRTMEPEISDLVFFSPIEASFVYTTGLDLFNDPFDGQFPQFGRARSIDGVWRITRSTLCQDILKTGVGCTT